MITFDDKHGLASTGTHWWARSVVFPGRWVVFGQGTPVRWYVVDDFGALAQVRVRP